MPKPIDEQEFSQLMHAHGLEPDEKSVAVAVSGGADSMALSLLVARWGKGVYLSFDHGLRAGSDEELKKVHAWLSAKGLKHVTLSWQGEKPESGIQHAAREARYAAMEHWCKDNGVEHLLLAHHQGDQAETFIMRLARGSGVDGLCAMSAISPPLCSADGPTYVRPLLEQPKERLLATLEHMEQGWIEDPSNENMIFTRVQARKLLHQEPIEGLNNKRMAATARRMKRVRQVLDRLTGELIEKSVVVDEDANKIGYCTLDIDILRQADDEIALRLLSRLLTHFGGAVYPPKLLPVERLLAEFMREGFSGATLAGCHINAHKNNLSNSPQVLIGREENAISHEVKINPGSEVFWDNRFLLHVDGNLPPMQVKKLNISHWRELCNENEKLAMPQIPRSYIPTVPAFYLDQSQLANNEDEIIAIPALNYWQNKLQGLTSIFQPKQGLRP